MNIFRKSLLKLARGVPAEEAGRMDKLPAGQIVREDRPVLKLQTKKVISKWLLDVALKSEVEFYAKQEMAENIGRQMKEQGLIRYTEVPDDDPYNEGGLILTAELWAVQPGRNKLYDQGAKL